MQHVAKELYFKDDVIELTYIQGPSRDQILIWQHVALQIKLPDQRPSQNEDVPTNKTSWQNLNLTGNLFSLSTTAES